MQDWYWLAADQFDRLLAVLRERAYTCIGPQIADGAIVYRELAGSAQLPWGMGARQAPGEYRIHSTEQTLAFAWANGPQCLKPLTFAAEEPLWQVVRDEQGKLTFQSVAQTPPQLAVIGVRACDLAALNLQDRHFLAASNMDQGYRERRDALFLIAVNCSTPAATCFCAATGDGPAAQQGYDLVLDELDGGFCLRSGSRPGAEVLTALELPVADAEQRAQALAITQQATNAQTRTLPGPASCQLLGKQMQHPHWQEIGERCLACGNCTQVCPSCFCFAEQEEQSPDGCRSQHTRVWDSCFTEGHAFMHGRSIRPSRAMRYRQWLTHKLDYWQTQYGRVGCVGCGRCISWCPVGIDLTEEVPALLENDDV